MIVKAVLLQGKSLYFVPMEKQHTWILSIMILAIAGIAVLQGHYSYQEYWLQRDTLQRDIDSAFAQAVAAEKQMRLDSLQGLFTQWFMDSSKVVLKASLDTTEGHTVFHVIDAATGLKTLSLHNKPDTMRLDTLTEEHYAEVAALLGRNARRQLEKDGVVFYWTEAIGEDILVQSNKSQANADTLRAAFAKTLQDRGILLDFDVQFFTDRSSIGPGESDMYSLSLATHLRDGQQWARAGFPSVLRPLLRRSWLVLAGSLSVVGLTAGCFWLLWRIILRQRQLVQIKDDFIDNITHELQTPLATLMAANENMQRYQVLGNPTRAERYLELSRQELQRLSQLVDRVLQSSIEGEQGLRLCLHTLSPADWLQEQVQQFRLQYGEQLILSMQTPSSLPAIRTDPAVLRQILENLVENAVKYAGTLPACVCIALEAQADELQYTVADQGTAIPGHYRERIFEKFFRVPRGRQYAVKGYGIGLYQVRQLSKALGGEIFLAQASTRGNVFVLRIPLQYEA